MPWGPRSPGLLSSASVALRRRLASGKPPESVTNTWSQALSPPSLARGSGTCFESPSGVLTGAAAGRGGHLAGLALGVWSPGLAPRAPLEALAWTLGDARVTWNLTWGKGHLLLRRENGAQGGPLRETDSGRRVTPEGWDPCAPRRGPWRTALWPSQPAQSRDTQAGSSPRPAPTWSRGRAWLLVHRHQGTEVRARASWEGRLRIVLELHWRSSFCTVLTSFEK